MKLNDKEPPLPGHVLDTAFLKKYGINHTQLGEALGIHRNHVARLVKGQQRITFELAVGLSKVLDTPPDYWIRLQADYDSHLSYEAIARCDKKVLIDK